MYARQRKTAKIFAIVAALAGVGGSAVTIYDRADVSSKINDAGGLGNALAQVGWGLNLALVASLSLVIAGLALVILGNATPASSPNAGEAADAAHRYRECPHCKEPMRRDASVCPHCRMESEPWVFEHEYWFKRDDTGRWVWLDEETGEWSDQVEEEPTPSPITGRTEDWPT